MIIQKFIPTIFGTLKGIWNLDSFQSIYFYSTTFKTMIYQVPDVKCSFCRCLTHCVNSSFKANFALGSPNNKGTHPLCCAFFELLIGHDMRTFIINTINDTDNEKTPLKTLLDAIFPTVETNMTILFKHFLFCDQECRRLITKNRK